jgi:hypothetical protein
MNLRLGVLHVPGERILYRRVKRRPSRPVPRGILAIDLLKRPISREAIGGDFILQGSVILQKLLDQMTPPGIASRAEKPAEPDGHESQEENPAKLNKLKVHA